MEKEGGLNFEFNKTKETSNEANSEYRKTSLEFEADIEDNSALNKLWTVSFVCLIFMIVELIGGYIANSIAIMSDAAHMFSDLLGFIISIISIYIARKTATHQMSYGYHRAEVIGALGSVTIIWGLTIWLVYEAILRIFDPKPVKGGVMLIIAVLGLIFNIVMGVILAYEGIDHGMHNHSHGGEEGHGHKHEHEHDSEHEHLKSEKHEHEYGNNHDHEHDHDNNHDYEHEHDHDKKKDHGHSHGGNAGDINVRAALIHVIGDALQNVGVIISGIIIYYKPYLVVVDPICTLLFAVIVFFSTIRILKDCVSVIMEGSPIDNVDKLKERLLKIEGVEEIHDLHIWSLSMGKVSMTCHLKSKTPQISLKKATELMNNKYNITHTTIQVEDEDHDDGCKQTLH